MMDKNLLVIDNFLDNPDEVRQNALSLNFNKIEKNVPGARSKALEGNLKKEVEDKLKIAFSCEEIKWDLESDSFCFQSCQEGTQTWTHLDNRSEDSAEWSAVLYLTPDAPLDAGTGIFENEDSDMNVAVGNAMMHRYYGHKSFNMRPQLEKLSRWLCHHLPMGSVIGWAYYHRVHHNHSDTDDDPHSPTIQGIWHIIAGVWKYKISKKVIKDLMTPELVWWHKYYFHYHIILNISLLIVSPWFLIYF